MTGGGSGIGRATAAAFARDGAHVIVADIDGGAAEAVARAIGSRGGIATPVAADVTKPDDVASMVDASIRAHGAIDIAVNAAGTEGPGGRAADISEADWERTLRTNLTGVWLCLRAEIRAMLQRGAGGRIVNVASVGGLVGYAGSSAYSASKHGVIGLTRSAALEYAADGIRINAVCPGAVETPMLDRVTAADPGARERLRATKPAGRLATAEEVAEIVVWLCGDGAAYVVGHALVVDGGMLAGLR